MPGKNLSRDPERTPMQWDSGRNAGFTEGKPWLRLDKTFARNNVKLQENDGYSTLSLYRRLIKLRQSEPSLMTGEYRPVYSDQQMIAYIRQEPGHARFLVVLNLSHRPCYFTPPNRRFKGSIEIDSFPEEEGLSVSDTIALSGDEGLIVRLEEWDVVE